MKFFNRFRKNKPAGASNPDLRAVYEDLTALIVRWEDRQGGQKFADELHVTLAKRLAPGEVLPFKVADDSTLPPALMSLDHEGAVGEVPTESYLAQLRQEASQRREDNARGRYYVS